MGTMHDLGHRPEGGKFRELGKGPPATKRVYGIGERGEPQLKKKFEPPQKVPEEAT